MELYIRKCTLCNEALGSSKRINSSKVFDHLKFLNRTLKDELFQESLICESCSTKVVSAFKFKTLILEKFQNIKLENNVASQNHITCEICNRNIDSNDCILLCDSVTETGLNLKKYLSENLDFRIFENILSCEECHKLFLNYYTITNLLDVFDNNSDNNNKSYIIKTESDGGNNKKVKIEESTKHHDGYSRNFIVNKDEIYCDPSGNEGTALNEEVIEYTSRNEDVDINFENKETIYIKEGYIPIHEEYEYAKEKMTEEDTSRNEGFHWKIEEIDLKMVDEEPESEEEKEEDISRNEGFHLKSEEIDLKMDEDKAPETEEEDETSERNWLQRNREEGINDVLLEHGYCLSISNDTGFLDSEMSTSLNSESSKIHKCGICEFQINCENSFNHHMSDHMISNEDKIVEDHQMIVLQSNNEFEMFRCQICKFQAKYQHSLQQHIMVVHKDIVHLKIHKNTDQDKIVKDDQMIVLQSNNEFEMFSCQFCKFQTKYQHRLQQHIMVVHKDIGQVEKFKCQICKYRTYQQNLKFHMKIHKNTDQVEMFKCQFCKFQAKYQHSLQQHIMFVHKEIGQVEKFKCQICRTKYRTKYRQILKFHMKVHKNTDQVEMFKYDICKYQARRKEYDRNHIKFVHKNIDQVDMFKCQFCKFQTKHQHSLQQHIMCGHKDIGQVDMFKCQKKQEKQWENHLEIHKNIDNVKMFNCPFCEFQTKHQHSLQQHIMVVHKYIREYKRFKCQICKYHTQYKRYLERHMKRHKNTDEVKTFKC